MTTQLLIYENVVQRQGELGAAGGRWSSPRAAAEYPIVFAGTEETVMPVAAVDAELLAHPKGKAGGRKKSPAAPAALASAPGPRYSPPVQPFDYAAPSSVDDALAMLARHADAKVLAGGQSLLPILNYRLARPRLVVDVNALPLDSVALAEGRLRLGALTRHATLTASPLVARECPLLGEAAALVGNVRVRTLGTLGGSLAHADPAAELPLAVVTLDATLEVLSARGARTIAARDFFTGYLTTMLGPDELLTAIDVPVTRGMGSAIEEFSRRPGDFALVAVAALVRIDARGRVEEVRVGLGGVGPRPVRVAAVEDALRGQEPTADRIARGGEIVRAAVEPAGDAFASAGYRKLLAEVLTKRALTRAVARAMEISA